MAHINTGPGEHDPTASAFIIRLDEGEPKLLLHTHKKFRKVIQPAGHTEKKESTWQGILREIKEETGYNLSQLRVLQPTLRMKSLNGAILHPQSFVSNTHEIPGNIEHYHTDLAFAFIADGLPEGTPAKGESKDFRWVSADELAELSASQTIENVRQIGMFALTAIYPAWKPVSISEFQA